VTVRPTKPLPVRGIFETHLTVSDLDRSVAFYRDIVGLPLAMALPERGAAFFWVTKPGEAMIGLWSLGSAPIGLSLHVAFTASVADVLGACDRLRSSGVAPLSFFGTDTTEPSVIGWMPAAAVYFRDPDGHMLEYLAMLDTPPRPDRGILPWSQWVGLDDADIDYATVRIAGHTGSRSELRGLYEMAEDSTTQLDSYIDAGDVLVARTGDRVVGHLQLVDSDEPGASEIKNMAVEPSCRGRGIGSRLIQEAVERVRRRGARMLIVGTAAADLDNLRFYQRSGFRMRSIERDAFTPTTGYPSEISVGGIDLQDRVWLDLTIDPLDQRLSDRSAPAASREA
jgi:lactoylglutathione lyase